MTKADDAVWIERYTATAAAPDGPIVAVKDLIDIAGSVTTGGCRALADAGVAATADAPCVTALRAAGCRIVGKVNLHELAFGISGVNPWYGTPANPADPGRIPGGSSSGSAVAVAIGEADFALGSDTGGSVRIPAACCGVVGLKTTHGRIPLEGVWPLAPSYDTVGPLAATVAGIVSAMAALEPGFEPESAAAVPEAIGRLRIQEAGVRLDPVIEAAVDAALRLAELDPIDVGVDGWADAYLDQQVQLGAEAVVSDGPLLEQSGGVGISAETLERLARSVVPAAELERGRERGGRWVEGFAEMVARHGVVALATLPWRPPIIGERAAGFNVLTSPINLAGMPALTVPVPVAETGRPVTGLQLVAARGGEELLLAVGARIEAAVAR